MSCTKHIFLYCGYARRNDATGILLLARVRSYRSHVKSWAHLCRLLVESWVHLCRLLVEPWVHSCLSYGHTHTACPLSSGLYLYRKNTLSSCDKIKCRWGSYKAFAFDLSCSAKQLAYQDNSILFCMYLHCVFGSLLFGRLRWQSTTSSPLNLLSNLKR